MSAAGGVGVGGLRELRRDLRGISAALPREVLPKAGRASAELILPAARALSPRGATGRLERSHRVLASQRRASVAAGNAEAFYGPALHKGTGPRRQKTTGRSTGRLPRNPWLERALAAVGELQVVRVYEQVMTGELRRYGLG